MIEVVPICSKCRKKMFKERDKDSGIIYWQCKKKCIFHTPVFKKKLSKNEKDFLKDLTN